MKLKKWLKYLDPMCDAIVYTDKTPEGYPAFDGPAFDIPKKYKNMKIGRTDNNSDEPIFITHFINEHGATIDRVTINLIEK